MCPHATTTTVAFLYGEGPESHGLHVATCADCSAVAAEHQAVASALAGVWPALRRPDPARWRAARLPLRAGWTVALAAAVLLAVGYGAWPDRPTPPAPILAESPGMPTDRFDVDLDDLDLDVTSLELELL